MLNAALNMNSFRCLRATVHRAVKMLLLGLCPWAHWGTSPINSEPTEILPRSLVWLKNRPGLTRPKGWQQVLTLTVPVTRKI